MIGKKKTNYPRLYQLVEAGCVLLSTIKNGVHHQEGNRSMWKVRDIG